MSRKQTQTDSILYMGWHKAVLIVLVLSLCLLLGCDNLHDAGVTEPQQLPTFGTEASCPTEETPSTEGSLPTETAEPTQTTGPTEPPATEPLPTEPPTESTAPLTESTVPPTEESTAPVTIPPMQIQISPDRTEVLLIPKHAKAFNLRDLTRPLEYDIYNFKTVYQRLDTSVPVSLSVKITNQPQGVEVTSIVFTLADNEAFTNGRTFRPEGNQNYVRVPYLLAGKQYYYRVCISFSDGTTEVLHSSFRTAAAPRLISIDGIVNVRDIGGWKTMDGSVIRQGLLYRGSELDGAIVPEYKLTAEGLRQMREELGIRTDMDLRYPAEIGTFTYPLGEDVTHIVYDARPYTAAFHGPGKTAVRNIFADLADPDKYPVYMHCTYGADRAGTISFLLEALLGVSEENLQREYELSTMYHTWVDSYGYQTMVTELKTWEGETLQEKAETFVLHCGVTPEQIAQIRDILLERP